MRSDIVPGAILQTEPSQEDGGLFRCRGRRETKQVKVNCFSHGVVTRRRHVQVVTGIERCPRLARLVWITGRRIEIDDTVIGLAGTNPVVECLTLHFALRREIVGALEWRERSAEDLQPASVHTVNYLLVRPDQVRGARRRLLAGTA